MLGNLIGRVLGDTSSQKDISQLSKNAKELIDKAYEGIDPGKLIDMHTHLIGSQDPCFVNEEMLNSWGPREVVQANIYKSAMGVSDMSNSNEQYLNKLMDYVRRRPHPGRHMLLAFDAHRNEKGEIQKHKAEFYTPPEYVDKVVSQHPEYFIRTTSIHPLRPDALEQLEKASKQGIKLCKWLPAAMGFDPGNPRIEPFYLKLKEYGMVLLTHGGVEKAVRSEEYQKYGNPLLLKRPLELGVKVIIAHCASMGKNVDHDDPKRKEVDNFDLCLRMMDKFPNCFADISAMGLVMRTQYLKPLLKRTDLHDRILNGSDYPLCNVRAINLTTPMVLRGLISPSEAFALMEIYDCNPLLFDFVVKRTVHVGDLKFPASVFMENQKLGIFPIGHQSESTGKKESAEISEKSL